MELKPSDSICTELRDHVLDLYQRVISGLIKSVIKTEDAAKKSE